MVTFSFCLHVAANKQRENVTIQIYAKRPRFNIFLKFNSAVGSYALQLEHLVIWTVSQIFRKYV